MKDYLIDIPVKLNIWIREEFQQQQFEIIKQVRPSILFLQSDGGRNDKENSIIKRNREMIDNGIDWNCTVYRLYEEQNNGLYSMDKKTLQVIWDNVDRCVFLEDDDLPSVSFFAFCKEMLDKYEFDTRIQGISGFNPLGIYEKVTSDYFFCGEFTSWGCARWKRSCEILDDRALAFIDDEYIKELMKKGLEKDTYKRAMSCGKNGIIDGHIPANEFFAGIAKCTQNALFIMPKKNLITNIGADKDAIHSNSFKTLTKAEKKLYYSERYELSFPLKHPKYLIRDRGFEIKYRRLIGTGHPIVQTYRKIVKLIKILRYEGFRGLVRKYYKKKTTKEEK